MLAMNFRPFAVHQFFHDSGERRERNANLLHIVAVANRHFVIRRGIVIADGLHIDGDTERRADFVLAAVESTNRCGVVVDRVPTLAQIGAQLMRGLDDARVFLQQR